MEPDYEEHALYGRLNLKRSANSESGYEDVCARKKAGVVISFYGKYRPDLNIKGQEKVPGGSGFKVARDAAIYKAVYLEQNPPLAKRREKVISPASRTRLSHYFLTGFCSTRSRGRTGSMTR